MTHDTYGGISFRKCRFLPWPGYGCVMLDSLVFAIALTDVKPQPAPIRSPAAAHTKHALQNLAPADEYFGRLRMSALAIRMRIGVLGRRYQARTASDDDLLHDAGDLETAMHLWHDRYPSDTWLPPTAFHLAQLYAEIQTPAARSRALATFRYVGETFPRARDAHLARARVAQGFGPFHDESPVVASVSPSPSPAASGSGGPTVTPSTSPVATSTPAAKGSAPSASAAPVASSTPR